MLTNIDHIKDIRDISANLKDSRIVPFIKEVEDAYILPAIGADLYERLDTHTAEDQILLDGGYYNGSDGRDFCHGLRRATAYFAYARLLKNNQINVTAFGVTQKTGTYSSPISENGISEAAIDAKKMGDIYLSSCVKYLHRNDEPTCGHRPATGGAKLKLQIINR